MVIFKRLIPNYDEFAYRSDGIQLLKAGAVEPNILHGAAENSLTGLLLQLSSLSLIATELFDGILRTSKGTFERIASLSNRVQNANSKLAEVEQFMIDHNHRLLFTCMGYTFTDKAKEILFKVDQQNISPANNPEALAFQYNSNCEPHPAFAEELNQLMIEDKKKPCIKLYSNPQFFFEHWAKRELQRQKQERRVLRARKKREEKEKQKTQRQVATIQLHYKRFDKEGNRIDDSQLVTSHMDNSMVDMRQSTTATTMQEERKDMASMEDDHYYDNVAKSPVDETPASTQTRYTSAFESPTPSYNVPSTPGPIMSPQQLSHHSSMSMTSPVPSFHNEKPSVANQMPVSPAMFNSPPPPPPSSGMVPPPPPPPGPPPPAPLISSGGGLNDLISKGVQLKKSEQMAIKTQPTTLLEQIREGKKLKSAEERKLADKPVVSTGFSVADILNKKFENVLDDDSESDDSEFDDDDWD